MPFLPNNNRTFIMCFYATNFQQLFKIFQGPTGFPGSPGKVGPPGPTVSMPVI